MINMCVRCIFTVLMFFVVQSCSYFFLYQNFFKNLFHFFLFKGIAKALIRLLHTYLYCMLTQDAIKQKLGIFAADLIEQDMLIGLGTGSTVYYLLKELGRRKQQGLDFTAVCTSRQTQHILMEEGINYVSLD